MVGFGSTTMKFEVTSVEKFDASSLERLRTCLESYNGPTCVKISNPPIARVLPDLSRVAVSYPV